MPEITDHPQTQEIEKAIGFAFKNRKLLTNVFVHRSYLNEHRRFPLPNNERLEFLGDSVLAFLTSRFLYLNYPRSPEGDLTNYRASLVCAPSLAAVGQKLKLGQFLLLSHGEESTGGRERPYLLANTLEALIGALYLDRGLKRVEAFLAQHLFPCFEEILKNQLYRDYKSLFQEKAQAELNFTPIYQVVAQEGPDHAKTFWVGVFVLDQKVGEGKGNSKQKAEQEAARTALEKWQKEGKLI